MGAEITGIGWVTSTGMGRGRKHQSFAMPRGKLPEIDPADMFKKPYPNFRRMDEYSRLGLTAIALALIDAGLSEWSRERDIGIIAATFYGCLGTDVDYYNTVIPDGGAHASPALFSYTLANSFLGEAAIRFGLTGTNYIITEQRPTDLVGLQTALDHIVMGDVEKILGGVCDLGCPEIFGEPSKVPPGAVFFMLEKSPTKERSSYGKLQLNRTGDLLLNGAEVKDLTGLVRKCITIRNPHEKITHEP
jgi:3-oxoacyl-[acyl-carrier-protein] synthase II